MENFEEKKSQKQSAEGDYIKEIIEVFPHWEEEILRINDKRKILYSGDDKLKNYEKIVKFCKILQKKYGRKECLKHLAYHLVISSTPEKEEIQFFDFSGEDSIEKFLDELLEEQNLDIKNKNSN